MNVYETPRIVDHGSVADLTAALAIGGTEDGASKAQPIHHSIPLAP